MGSIKEKRSVEGTSAAGEDASGCVERGAEPGLWLTAPWWPHSPSSCPPAAAPLATLPAWAPERWATSVTAHLALYQLFMLTGSKYLLSLLHRFMPWFCELVPVQRGGHCFCWLFVQRSCKRPGQGTDGILCPFMSTVCNSWTLSQMSVIFCSLGLSPSSPSTSTGIFLRPEGLLLAPAPPRFHCL